jgi:RNA polymerase sigma-70 factor (ECF subfamily)
MQIEERKNDIAKEICFEAEYVAGFDPSVRFLTFRGLAWDDATDVAQEAWIKALQHIRQYRGDCTFLVWINTIAWNVHRDRRRRNWNSAIFEAVKEQRELSVFKSPAAGLDCETLLKLCPEQAGAVLKLFYLDGHSCEEIAQVRGVSAASVRLVLFRTRRLIRKRLALRYRKF